MVRRVCANNSHANRDTVCNNVLYSGTNHFNTTLYRSVTSQKVQHTRQRLKKLIGCQDNSSRITNHSLIRQEADMGGIRT